MALTALDFISKYEWPIFPCNPLDKRPLVKGGFYSATKDPAIIQKWWETWPNAMIAVPMGKVSGVFCLDLDRKKIDGKEINGIATWHQLLEQHGDISTTRMHETPNAGRHLVFQYVEGISSIPLNKLGPGLEIKGDGGYIVVPPSRMHDGRPYIGNDAPVTPAPAWLLNMIFTYLNLNVEDPEFDNEIKQDSGKGIVDEFMDFPPTDPEEIKEALRHIPSDDYDLWFRVAGALYKELGDSGYWLFDEWSKKSKKYSMRDVKRKWKDASKITNISAGTIYRMANEHASGWREQYRKNRAQQSQQAKAAPSDSKPLVLSDAEFIAKFKPPSYIITGLLQRRFVYSLTGPTGSGKTCIALRIAAHVITGTELNGRRVKQGKVLYFAGENPDDVRVRWIKLCEDMNITPKNGMMYWLPGVPPLNNTEIRSRIYKAAQAYGPFTLVIIDTSAAYFQGDDENSNTQLGEHARLMRRFVGLPGNPIVLVTCHPTKYPDLSNLIPRGGGAFLNEMDGNLACIRDNFLIEITTHGKWRGPDFSSLMYRLHPCKLDTLVDEDGAPIWSVITMPISDEEHTNMEDAAENRREELMQVMFRQPGLSMTDLAKELDWQTSDGKPNKSLVQRILNKLVLDRVVEKQGGRYALTKKASGKFREKASSKGKTENLI
jgi:Bifunctional DNA primase/polymerase, N-terminal/AAA domain/Primase C terminal 2 (PriCT-2)